MMKVLRLGLCAAAASFVFSAGAAMADPLGTPAMSSTLSANPKPTTFDAGPFGKVYVTGAVSGLVNGQTNAVTPLDKDWVGDLSNAQVFIQKTDGVFQFFVQAGAYSLPALGFPYHNLYDSKTVVNNTFSYLPQAFVKIQPTPEFSIQAGKLPTLVGAEYTFTFENVNVNRGLLWSIEPAVSRGVQANYAKGPLTVSLSLTDGYYSNRYNWLTGLVSLAVTKKDTLAFVGGGNLGQTPKSSTSTYAPYNNGDIFNVLWTHTEDKWVFNPYFQYSHVDAKPLYGWSHPSSTWGVGVLGKVVLTPEWNVGLRGEYIKQTGKTGDVLAPVLVYGPGTDAYSLTVSPTFQKGIFFIRSDLAYVHASVPAFGSALDKSNQFRFTGEAGVLF
jgi:hypothetical protein